MSDAEKTKGLETKSRVVDAIVTLGQSQSVSSMSVRDICAEAKISRQTFYRHFLDKYDALSWFNQRQFEEIEAHVGKDMLWHDAAMCMLVHTYDNRRFYAIALDDDKDVNSLMRIVSRRLYASWRATIASYGEGALTEELDYQLKAWSTLGPELVADWVANDCPVPVDRLCSLMSSCTPHGMVAAMDEHVLAKRA